MEISNLTLNSRLTPKCPKPFFEVRIGHYSFDFDAIVLNLVVIGHFIMYMGI